MSPTKTLSSCQAVSVRTLMSLQQIQNRLIDSLDSLLKTARWSHSRNRDTVTHSIKNTHTHTHTHTYTDAQTCSHTCTYTHLMVMSFPRLNWCRNWAQIGYVIHGVCCMCVDVCMKGKDQNSSQCSLHGAHIKPRPDKTAKTAIYFKVLSLYCLFTGLLIPGFLLRTVSITNYGYIHL